MSTGGGLGDISRRNPQEDFELLARIGSGTYGDVYKARATGTGEMGAVKIIKLEPGDDFALIKEKSVDNKLKGYILEQYYEFKRTCGKCYPVRLKSLSKLTLRGCLVKVIGKNK
jgi:serine/threonine protein kinase